MSNGMYCSASQWIDSDSSSALICGRLIFLTMTALPDTPVAHSAVLMRLSWNRRWIESITAPASMIAPSTIASGGSDSIPMFRSWNSSFPFPPTLISTAFTADEPMSTPTRLFFLPKRPTGVSSTDRSQSDCAVFVRGRPRFSSPSYQNSISVHTYQEELKSRVKLTDSHWAVKRKLKDLHVNPRQD